MDLYIYKYEPHTILKVAWAVGVEWRGEILQPREGMRLVFRRVGEQVGGNSESSGTVGGHLDGRDTATWVTCYKNHILYHSVYELLSFLSTVTLPSNALLKPHCKPTLTPLFHPKI